MLRRTIKATMARKAMKTVDYLGADPLTLVEADHSIRAF
jgi:hypothetical protein